MTSGVEVEQETSAPPPKKNPGCAPDKAWSVDSAVPTIWTTGNWTWRNNVYQRNSFKKQCDRWSDSNPQPYVFATALCTTPLDYLTVYFVNNNNYWCSLHQQWFEHIWNIVSGAHYLGTSFSYRPALALISLLEFYAIYRFNFRSKKHLSQSKRRRISSKGGREQ